MTRRRDKTQMAADVSIALSSKLSDTAKFIVMKNVIWEWSLNDRKKPDCQIVSAGVDKLAQGFDLKDVRGGWTFEHIVPICVIQNLLAKTADVSKQRGILEKYAIACLVTKDEDALLREHGLTNSMPRTWRNGDDEFARYRQVGIEWVKRE